MHLSSFEDRHITIYCNILHMMKLHIRESIELGFFSKLELASSQYRGFGLGMQILSHAYPKSP